MIPRNLEVVPVGNSSAIERIMFDKVRSQLYIKFKNSPLYSYNIDEAIFEAFCQADSKGKFFHQNIKDNFPFTERLDN